MAFEGLTEKLNATFKKLRGKGRLTENDVREAMREVRLALLEADVSYKVVKEFVSTVTERAVGSDVLDSLTPAQQVVKIVNEELTNLMGGGTARLASANNGPTVVMMAGLQGAGKTTTTAKLRVYCGGRTASGPCWPPATCTGPPPSSSSRSWADSWTCPSLRRARETRYKSRRTPCATPGTTATTSSFWIPPAVSTWTRS